MIEKVLCIDDDQITLMLCSYTIKKAGFAELIDTCEDAKKALNYFENLKESEMKSPQLIFLDLNMPGMNGWEFLDVFNRDLRHYFPDTKVVILTSSINPEDKKKSESYQNIIKFIHKPLNTEHLEGLCT
ncbi:MAG: response regulator [Bacteroidia bacterium]